MNQKPFSLLYHGQKCRVYLGADRHAGLLASEVEIEFRDGEREIVARKDVLAPDDGFGRLGPDV